MENGLAAVPVTEGGDVTGFAGDAYLGQLPDGRYIYLYLSENDTMCAEACGVVGYYLYEADGTEYDGGELDIYKEDSEKSLKEYLPKVLEYEYPGLRVDSMIDYEIEEIVEPEYLFSEENSFCERSC